MTEKSNSPEQVGCALGETILQVFQNVPECTMRPTDISRKLVVSRVMVSRTISAIGKENSIELLTRIPGPETLRSIVLSAQKSGVSDDTINPALLAVNDFESLIRDQFGTRSALNAALSVHYAESRDQFEQSSRYKIFKGMSQLLGVESKVWLSCVVFSPCKTDESKLGRSHITGGAGLRRLRSDTPVRLAVGTLPQSRKAHLKKKIDLSVPKNHIKIDLDLFYENPQAILEIVDEQDRTIQIFSPPVQDKDAVYDLISGLHIPVATSKQSWPEFTRRGIAAFPDVPTRILNIDIVLHRDVFRGMDPEAFVYNIGPCGSASFREGNWEINRVKTSGEIIQLGSGLENIEIDEVPQYTQMVHRVCEVAGYDPSEFSMYRWRIQYPVYGFQYMLAFKVSDP